MPSYDLRSMLALRTYLRRCLVSLFVVLAAVVNLWLSSVLGSTDRTRDVLVSVVWLAAATCFAVSATRRLRGQDSRSWLFTAAGVVLLFVSFPLMPALPQ